MNDHEDQASEIDRDRRLPCSVGYPAATVVEAVETAKKLRGSFYVVKSAIHAGGRGKGKFVALRASVCQGSGS
jgi:succinyl-CoA synthetase beta subunit